MSSIQNKLLWGEGLFLRPQHFQLQDIYHEHRATQFSRYLNAYFWGVRRLQVEKTVLSSGRFQLREIEIIFPDGAQVVAPENDPLPEPYDLTSLAAGSSEHTMYLGLPILRSFTSNMHSDSEQNKAPKRYQMDNVISSDLYTNAVEGDVMVLRHRTRLLSELDNAEEYIRIPIAKLLIGSNGEWTLDSEYIPAVNSCSAAPQLAAMLTRLLEILRAKSLAMSNEQRQNSPQTLEFRSRDISSFWLLHTVNIAYSKLFHLASLTDLHPERLYQALLEIAGGLMTFSQKYAITEIQAYNHSDASPLFHHIDQVIRELLEVVVSAKYIPIALEEIKPSFHIGRIDSDKLRHHSDFYIAVAADMTPADIAMTVPMRFKVGAPDDVEKILLSAMPGVQLKPMPQVPSAIPVRNGYIYFSLNPSGALYQRMLESHSVMIYVPAAFTDLKFELMAITR